MSKKDLGYVELEWTCPNCGSKNTGLKKTCISCGNPQPESVQFELGSNQNLITDQQKLADLSSGADIHCPYCGTRNKADTRLCTQCGGDIKEGIKRQTGKVLTNNTQAGTESRCAACGNLNKIGEKTCSSCGSNLTTSKVDDTQQPVDVQKQSAIRPWMLLPVAAIGMLICVIIGYFLFHTTALSGTVQSISWQRTIDIEMQREVTREAWRDELPADSTIISCEQNFRRKQDNPAPNSKEVCSTELVDQGNGSAKVVETCYYEVYDDYCKYHALEWQVINKVESSGADLQPAWPKVNLEIGQREGQRQENYEIDFSTADGIRKYNINDPDLFVQFQPGSQWTLSVNTLGAVVDVSP